MTSPQPTPPEGLTQGEQEAVAALTTALAEGALIGAVALPPYLYSKLLHLGFNPKAIKAGARLALTAPLPKPGQLRGTATARVAADEPAIRATYLIGAIKRIAANLAHLGDKPGGLITALRDERRYLRQHLDAADNRHTAAQAVDQVAAEHGPWLQWATENDDRVEPECKALAGTRFTPTQPPHVAGRPVLPGSVHPHCRCHAIKAATSPITAQPAATT